jgi:hypothetical protein
MLVEVRRVGVSDAGAATLDGRLHISSPLSSMAVFLGHGGGEVHCG